MQPPDDGTMGLPPYPLGNGNGNGHAGPPGLFPAGRNGIVPVVPGFAPAPAVVLPPAMSAGPTVPGLLKALRRHWLMATVVGLLCAGAAGAAAWSFMPTPLYTAKAILVVASTDPMIVFKTSMSSSKTTDPKFDARNYQLSQEQFIKSRTVLNEALKLPAVTKLASVRKQGEAALDWLLEQLVVEFNGEVLNISMQGNNPQELTTLVNAVTDSYLTVVVDKEKADRQARLEQLREVLKTYQQQLEVLRMEKKGISKKVGSSDRQTLLLAHQFSIERHATAVKQQIDVQSQLKRLEAEYKAAKEMSDSVAKVSPATVEEAVNADPNVAQDVERVAQLQDKFNRTKSRVSHPGDPALRKDRADLEAARKSLTDRRAKLRPVVAQRLNEQASAGPRGTAADLERQIKIHKNLDQSLTAEVAMRQKETQSFNDSSTRMEDLTDLITTADTASKQVAAEVEALKVEVQAPTRVRLFERASLPKTADTKKLLMVTIFAALGSFACVLFGVSWLEYQARRIDTVDEVVHGLGMRLVGSLPAMPDRARRRVSGPDGDRDLHWHNLLIESVDATRTTLLHLSRQESLKVVMVTSALGGEGKTSLASHLATSLARAGRRTLLIDTDMRSPAAHRMFDLPLEPGLCELLRGEAELADAIRPTMANGLWMIPAGQCDGRAIQALAQDGLRSIFDRLREQFDFIVVDSAPVLPVADSLLIGQHVDAALFSILREVSRVHKVYAAYERVTSLGIRMLGAVVTGARCESYGKSYQYALPSGN